MLHTHTRAFEEFLECGYVFRVLRLGAVIVYTAAVCVRNDQWGVKARVFVCVCNNCIHPQTSRREREREWGLNGELI